LTVFLAAFLATAAQMILSSILGPRLLGLLASGLDSAPLESDDTGQLAGFTKKPTALFGVSHEDVNTFFVAIREFFFTSKPMGMGVAQQDEALDLSVEGFG
jgi:hypothetical protein